MLTKIQNIFFHIHPVQKKIKKLPLIKLNLGCGADLKEEWINIDNGSQFGSKHLDLKYNFVKGLPFKPDSVDYIYHEHLIEHLTRAQAVNFFKSCFKALRNNGIMRIACPDLEMIIEDYQKNQFEQREWLKKFSAKYLGRSRCELLNISLRDWGHQYVFDFEDLSLALQEAGFLNSSISRFDIGQSETTCLQELETRKDSLVVEAKKVTNYG